MGAIDGQDPDMVLRKIGKSIFADVSATNDDDFFDPSVMDKFGAHQAGFPSDKEPSALGGDARSSAVTDDVHLGVMAADLHAHPRRDRHRIAQTFIAAAEFTPSTRPAVVAVHQDDVALGVKQQSPKLAARTVRGFGKGETLFDADLYVLFFHTGSFPNVWRLRMQEKLIASGAKISYDLAQFYAQGIFIQHFAGSRQEVFEAEEREIGVMLLAHHPSPDRKGSPMSTTNIRFRDPQTGQMHTVQAELVKKVKQDNPQSTEALKHNPKDGKIDLFVQADKNYSDGYGKTTRESYHLQINNTALTNEQVKALAEALRGGSDNAIQIDEGRGFTVFSAQSDIYSERSRLFGQDRHNPNVSLTGNDADKVFLSRNGVFSTAAGTAPAGLKESAKALYNAAETADKLAEGQNLFSLGEVSQTTKKNALSQIRETLEQARTSSELSPNEAAQVRSSAATVLTEMISSLGNKGTDAKLKQQAFAQLNQMIQNETIGGLKESMIFNAVRVQSGLGDVDRAAVDKLRAEIAPTHPPTDKWFADGKREINISFAAGHGEGFYEGITDYFKQQGFTVKSEGNRSGWNAEPRQLQLTKRINGEEYKVNVDLRDFKDDSFKDIANDKYDVVVYQGHSNLGNNTRNSLKNAPDATGKDKLIFLGLCSGKDNIDGVREAFPEAQLVTTFNSSYFNTKPIAGGEVQFTQGEDAKALMQIVNGALNRESWNDINKGIRDNAVGWSHKDGTIGNYVTPLDLQLNARFRDTDNDGQAMTMDRHFNLDVMEVRPGVSSGLTPRDNNADGRKLNGELPHLAAAFANTMDLYNPTYDQFSHKGRIMADGYYKGNDNDPIVKFETRTENGEKAFVMKVNERYAHIGEEALRAITMVEYNRHLAKTETAYPIKDKTERELVGLLTAAASLTYDAGYRDAAVFEALVKHYNLPAGLRWSDAGGLIDQEHHDYTGSAQMARKWMEKLSPDTLQALRTALQ